MPDKTQAIQSLLQVLNILMPLDERLLVDLSDNCRVIEHSRKKILLEEGQVSDTIYYIYKGACRVYHLDERGVQTTSWLLLENDFLISVYSFFTGKPSFEYLQTLEDSILVVLSKSQLENLYLKYPAFNIVGRKITENYYIRNEEQAMDLRKLTAADRYYKLLTEKSGILNRIPLGYIASYLGINQETLSRIRRQS